MPSPASLPLYWIDVVTHARAWYTPYGDPHNRDTTSVTSAGWSVPYAGATCRSWQDCQRRTGIVRSRHLTAECGGPALPPASSRKAVERRIEVRTWGWHHVRHERAQTFPERAGRRSSPCRGRCTSRPGASRPTTFSARGVVSGTSSVSRTRPRSYGTRANRRPPSAGARPGWAAPGCTSGREDSHHCWCSPLPTKQQARRRQC